MTFADGGYWFPARVDLDTVVSKLNTSDISDILVIRGPLSVRLGPGFAFLDIQVAGDAWRLTTGEFEAHGGSSFTYRSNGTGLQGQQSLSGGNAHWGFRLTYDVNVAGDYSSGDCSKLPSSFNNQFVNFAYGIDLAKNQTLEMRYLHVQQYNVLLPGLLTDINSLATDGFTARYTAKETPWFDRLTVDAWINQTTFNGGSPRCADPRANPGPRQYFPGQPIGRQCLACRQLQSRAAGHHDQRECPVLWHAHDHDLGRGHQGQLLGCADARLFRSNYNEFDAFNLSVLSGTNQPANLGIPSAQQLDAGGFADGMLPIGENVTLKAGGRFDYLNTRFLHFGPNVPMATYLSQVGTPIDRNFMLFGGYATAEAKLNSAWTAQLGYGFAERPPTLTELYTGGAFLGLIQNGFNSIYGDPTLRPEQMHELNASLTGKYDEFRIGGNAFYAFVPNYITYQNLGPFTVDNIAIQGDTPLTGTTPIEQWLCSHQAARWQLCMASMATWNGMHCRG